MEADINIYTVKAGDSVYRIARENGVSVESIVRDNELENPADLTIGRALVIIKPELAYRVKEGDTLSSIAEANGVTLTDLYRNNPFLKGKPDIYTGEELYIKLGERKYGEIPVQGFVYPGVSDETLRKTLPYLTYLTIFSYSVGADGSIDDIDDGELIERAKEYGAAPVMMIANLNERGFFDNSLAGEFLSDREATERLISAVSDKVKEKGYRGVNADFEYIPSEYGEAYADFLTRLREKLSEDGIPLFVSVAPKYSGDMSGVLYEAHNYPLIGNAADYVQLMTYEWGYTYGEPMAVSPLDKVKRVLDYASEVIEPSKLLLGVPNYGYDWKLPFVAGESRAVSLSNTEAVELAVKKRVSIEYDETSEAPYFRYFETNCNGSVSEHIVWFEDARSIDAMAKAVNDYSLGGIGIWNTMSFFPQMYIVLNSLFDIKKI